LGEFSPLGNKKWAGESNKGKIWEFYKKHAPHFEKKKS
jgi:hypothetical protein